MILKYSLQYISRIIEAACMCFSKNLQLFKVIHCIYCTLDSLLNFPPCQIFFTSVANTTSTPTGWDGEGWAGSHKVADKGYVFTRHREMTIIGAIFTSTCHTKHLNPWPNSSAGRVVIHSRLSACQGKMGPFKGYPSTRGCQTGLRRRPE